MAIYSIRTTRQQEVGLKFSYDHYADKTVYPTQADWFQYRIDQQVTNPMFTEQQQAQTRSFDESFKTIPEAEQPAANTEIQTVITAHGGTIVPPAGVVVVPPPPLAMTEAPPQVVGLPPLPEQSSEQ